METIDAKQLAQMLDLGDVTLVDVLPEAHYAKVHIPGARNIPLKTLKAEGPQDLDRDERIVVYCSSSTCPTSPEAGALLEAAGFTHIYHFQGGIVEWMRSGRAVVRPAAT